MFAHQGGWDEILWVMIPISAMVFLLLVATKRIRAGNEDTRTGRSESDSGDVGAE